MTEVPAALSADWLSSLLARHARDRGDAVAVRYKQRGLYRTHSWRALAHDLELLVARERGTAPEGHALGLRWVLATLASALGDSTTVSASPLCVATVDDRLWLEPGTDPAATLLHWLVSGSVLGIGEAVGTALTDRRELAPTLLFADDSWYDALSDEVHARARQGSRARRAVVEWALRVGTCSRPGSRVHAGLRFLAGLLVLRPLADQLGLARTRLALTTGEPGASARALFAALGVPVSKAGSEVTPRVSKADDAPEPGADGLFSGSNRELRA
jgi:hypothetical protein